jgi:hypothetical protein
LYATRNLRNWLQTASLLHSAKHVREGGSLKGSKGIIYTPNKKDRYTVCVNAGLVFAVFVAEKELILFFVNSPDREREKKIVRKGGGVYPNPFPGVGRNPSHGIGLKRKGPATAAPRPAPTGFALPPSRIEAPPVDTSRTDRMTPALFSTWFVRTDEKMPDLRQWPDWAYATWVSLQMNAISVNGDFRLAVQIQRNQEYLFYPHLRADGQGLGNFGTGKRMKDRGTMRTCLHHAIKVGMTREKHQTSHFHAMMMGRSSGPHIEEIDIFRKGVQECVRNPRTKKSLEAELSDLEAEEPLPEIERASLLHVLDEFVKREND